MYIFGYFCQKGTSARALRKKGHIDKKTLGGGGNRIEKNELIEKNTLPKYKIS